MDAVVSFFFRHRCSFRTWRGKALGVMPSAPAVGSHVGQLRVIQVRWLGDERYEVDLAFGGWRYWWPAADAMCAADVHHRITKAAPWLDWVWDRNVRASSSLLPAHERM